jgi:hypothetical protein
MPVVVALGATRSFHDEPNPAFGGDLRCRPSLTSAMAAPPEPKPLSAQTRANLKYLRYADQAEAAGKPELARLFRESANIEANEHFDCEAQALKLGGLNSANLEDAMADEHYENVTMYIDFAEQAEAANTSIAMSTTHTTSMIIRPARSRPNRTVTGIAMRRWSTTTPIIPTCITDMAIRIERWLQAARLRGPSNMMPAAAKQTAAPKKSHRSGRVPSTAQSQTNDALI